MRKAEINHLDHLAKQIQLMMKIQSDHNIQSAKDNSDIRKDIKTIARDVAANREDILQMRYGNRVKWGSILSNNFKFIFVIGLMICLIAIGYISKDDLFAILEGIVL